MDQPKRAVVCDDDPVIRRVVTTLLNDLGYEVIAEVDLATDAVQVVRLAHPDLVVLDVALMGMTGLEAIPAIRAAFPECRIVVFSGFDTARDEAMAAGASAVVDKTNPVELEETLRSLALS